MSELSPTRSAVIELREERLAMREGHVFLDEKCLLLAGEIVAELRRYTALEADFLPACERAAAALNAAIRRHGLEELWAYPASGLDQSQLEITPRSLMGVRLLEARLPLRHSMQPLQFVNASPEAGACRDAFALLVEMAAPLAAVAGNLERLYQEYRRALRRARALQDVLLPELDRTLYELEASLEDMEREDAIAMRLKTASAGLR